MITAPDIPGHRVAGVLGSGGFATVYRCWQVAVGREVAVKVDNRVLHSERDRRRFIREVTAAGRLSGHPHVIDVYDAGTLGDGRPYLVMELCPAGSLNDVLHTQGPMSPAQVRDIGIRLADALAAAHAAGVLHRDIKPANILINQYGMVGLSDFGLASIIEASGEQSASRDALTPAYASPESFQWAEPTALSDVYSLAATLYALLTGRPPRFPPDAGSPGLATILKLHSMPVDDVPGTPADLMALLRRSLSADPAQRPQSAAALRDMLAGRPVAAAVDPLVPLADPAPGPGRGARSRHAAARPAAPRRRRPAPQLLGVAAAAIVIAGAGAVLGVRFLPHGDGTGVASGRPTLAGDGPSGVQPSGVQPSGVQQSQRSGPAVAAEDTFGIPTVTAGCPAASVRVAAARCPAAPECWAGMVAISGAASAESVPCTQPHTWETFAIAILPADGQTFDQPMLEGNPTVRAVCSLPVLLRSRQGTGLRIPVSGWRADVLPPTEAAFNSGSHVYRCVANVVTGDQSTSQFRR